MKNYLFIAIEDVSIAEVKKHFADAKVISENVLFTMNYISAPLGVRLNIDRSQYISIECGAFVDFLLRGTKTGTMHTAIPDNNFELVMNEYDFSDAMKKREYFGFYFAFNMVSNKDLSIQLKECPYRHIGCKIVI